MHYYYCDFFFWDSIFLLSDRLISDGPTKEKTKHTLERDFFASSFYSQNRTKINPVESDGGEQHFNSMRYSLISS